MPHQQLQSLSLVSACHELESRLRADPTFGAEQYLAERPALLPDAEATLDLIYTEYVTRCELQQRRLAEELCRQFPQHAAEFKQQLAFDELAGHAGYFDSRSRGSDSTLAGQIRAAPELGDTANLIGERYELLDEIGRGGAAVIYRARQVDLNRIVAIKLLTASLGNERSLQLRFLLEGTVIARLQHPNIVEVFEVGESDGRAFLALEYCEGGTLAEMTAKARPSVQEAASLVRTLALAMQEAHRAGVVHRDLKPANILFTKDWIAKIADFGVAKLLEDQSGHTRTGAILGTPCYIAPEQIAEGGQAITGTADVYALGAILYELLTGRPPLVAETTMATLRRVQADEPVSPRRLRQGVPRDLETICLKCLQKRPHERYATAGQLAEDLQRFLEHRPVTARPIGRLTRLGRHARRHRAIWGLAATLLLSLGVGTGIASGNWYRIQWQREATEDAFDFAFERWIQLYRSARYGVKTTSGFLPLDQSQRDDIAGQFATFLDRYSDEVPIRYNIFVGYEHLAKYYRDHGELEQFDRFAAKSVEVARRLIREAERFPYSRRHLGDAYYRIAVVDQYYGRRTEALEGFGRAADAARRLLTSRDELSRRSARRTLAASHHRIALLLRSEDHSLSVAEFESACRQLRWLVHQNTLDHEFLKLRLIKCLVEMGKSLRQLDRIGEALHAFHEARSLCEGFTPADDQYRYSACALHVSACNQIAHAHKLKSYRPIDPHELQQWYAPAIHSFEQVLVERPGWDSGWRLLSIAHASLGCCFQKAGRREQALTAFQTALDIRQQLLASGRASEGDRDRAEHHSCRIATLELDLAL